jgi:hypothetical protein
MNDEPQPPEGDQAGPIPFPGETPRVIAAPAKFYALAPLVHDGKKFPAGAPLPVDMPLDSLKRLIRERRIGKAPLSPTRIVQRTADAPTTAPTN